MHCAKRFCRVFSQWLQSLFARTQNEFDRTEREYRAHKSRNFDIGIRAVAFRNVERIEIESLVAIAFCINFFEETCYFRIVSSAELLA
jgi:hypothetical protein